MSGGVFWDVCELSKILGSLSASWWGCVPVLLAVWHGVSSTGARKQFILVQNISVHYESPRNSSLITVSGSVDGNFPVSL